jgi:hypothetical protein
MKKLKIIKLITIVIFALFALFTILNLDYYYNQREYVLFAKQYPKITLINEDENNYYFKIDNSTCKIKGLYSNISNYLNDVEVIRSKEDFKYIFDLTIKKNKNVKLWFACDTELSFLLIFRYNLKL